MEYRIAITHSASALMQKAEAHLHGVLHKPFSDLLLSAALMSLLRNNAKHLIWNAKRFIMRKQFDEISENKASKGVTTVHILTFHLGVMVMYPLQHKHSIKGQSSLMCDFLHPPSIHPCSHHLFIHPSIHQPPIQPIFY